MADAAVVPVEEEEHNGGYWMGGARRARERALRQPPLTRSVNGVVKVVSEAHASWSQAHAPKRALVTQVECAMC